MREQPIAARPQGDSQDLRPTVRQAAEWLRNRLEPKPVQPNPEGTLDERCAWMRAKQAAREAAAILRAYRHE